MTPSKDEVFAHGLSLILGEDADQWVARKVGFGNLIGDSLVACAKAGAYSQGIDDTYLIEFLSSDGRRLHDAVLELHRTVYPEHYLEG